MWIVLRRHVFAIVVAAGALAAAPVAARAQSAPASYAGPLFDAHLHDNEEAFAAFPVEDVIALTGAAAKTTPPAA